MISKGFYDSLEAIAEERALDIEKILEKVEIAMQVACKNTDVPYKGTIKIDTDLEKKKIRFFNYYYVVEEVDPEGPRGQITLEEALLIKPKAKIGQEIKEEVDLAKFKRKAASMFRQNLLNELKGLEREEAFDFFNDKVGEIISARVIAVNDKFITFSLGKGMDATMGYRDAIPEETFDIGEEKKVYLSKVEKTTKGPRIYLSRSNKEIVRKLFEMYVPEIASGEIEIMGIAREAGSRTKIGVLSLNPDIEAKGACVGSGGLRIKAINQVLNGEKIDVFSWKDNPVDLIAQAMSPARVVSVVIDEEEKKAIAIVNDDQFSLAIGRSGQNVKLAAFATGWKIDIKKLSEAYTEGIDFKYNVNC